MKCIKDQEVSIINQTLPKQKVVIDDRGLRGTLTISKVRKYNPYPNILIGGKSPESWEIEITFEGKIFAKVDKTEWLTSEVLQMNNVSKIRVNKVLKRKLGNYIERRLMFWGISDYKTKKVTWI